MEYPCKGLDIIVIRPVFIIYVQNPFLNIDSPGYENSIICKTVVKCNDTFPVSRDLERLYDAGPALRIDLTFCIKK